jgi:hypothetical protein
MIFAGAISRKEPFNRLSGNRAQLEAGLGGELRIGFQDLDRKSHLVDDTLSRSVPAGEQLKVLKSVVGPIAVFVMDSFVAAKQAAKVLFHDVPVLQNASASFVRISPDRESHISVSSLKWFGNVVRESVKHGLGVVLVPALFVAHLPAQIEVRRAFAVDGGQSLSAVETSAAFLLEFLRSHTLVRPRARPAAVFGIFAPTLLIRAKLTRTKVKRLSASFAFEFNALNKAIWPAVFGQVRQVALLATKLVRIPPTSGEMYPAVNAAVYHSNAPLLSTHEWYTNMSNGATANLIGAL